MSVVKPMLERGELPTLAALINRGVFGYLKTVAPARSPVIWTTIATGKPDEEHGIHRFCDEKAGTPYTSNARRVKALWNITDDHSLSCNLVGYWITWPAEEINGVVVTQFSSKTQFKHKQTIKGSLFRNQEGSTWPPEYIEEIWPQVEEVSKPENLQRNVLGPVFGDLDEEDLPAGIQKLISTSRWAFEADAIYHAAARRLFREKPADLNIVYYSGTDVIAHRFWCYREPSHYSYTIPERYKEAFGKSIENYYRHVDRMAGELVELSPDNTRVILVSDHGMHADFLDGTNGGKPVLLSAHHKDGPPGVFAAAGPGIRKGPGVGQLLKEKETGEVGSIYDIAPTVLYLLDLPVGRDMKLGRVLKNILLPQQLERRAVEYVDTHDKGFRPPTLSISSGEGDDEFMERFRALGYGL
jgi:predicted AlkP superfamily phosphohydrolase/phosphomutase